MATIALPSPPPDASATVKGLVNTTAQTFAGLKTFNGGISVSGSVTLGNFSLSGNNLDITAAGTIGIGTTTATGVTIGNISAVTTLVGGTVVSRNDFSLSSSVAASAGTPLVNSQSLLLHNKYWNGSASIGYDIGLLAVMDSVTPTAHLAFSLGGTTYLNLNQAGTLYPQTNNTQSFGSSSFAWASGYFTNIDVSTGSTTMGIGTANASTINVGSAASTFRMNNGANQINQPALSALGNNPALKITAGGLLNSTLSTEINGFWYAPRTIQWATGAITTQREFLVQAPTYTFVAASTIATAATMALAGPPIAGTNATITTPYTLWVQTGDFAIGSPAATAGVTTQNSGLAHLVGAGWNGSASVNYDITLSNQMFATAQGRLQIGLAGADRASFVDVGGGLGALYLGPFTSNDYIFGGNNSLTFRAGGTTILQVASAAPYVTLPVAGVGTAKTVGLSLQNSTASTSLATQQNSQVLEFLGHAWNTTPTASDKTEKFWFVNEPVGGGGTVTTAGLSMYGSINGAAPAFLGSIQPSAGGGIFYQADIGTVYLRMSSGNGIQLNYGATNINLGTNIIMQPNGGLVLPNGDNVYGLGSSGNGWTNVYSHGYTLWHNGSITNEAQSATNTTAMTIAPNVADGASSIGLVVNNVTTLSTGKMISVQNGGVERLAIIGLVPGYKISAGAGTAMLEGNNDRRFYIDSLFDGFAMSFGGGGEYHRWDSTSYHPSQANLTLGTSVNPWAGLFVGSGAISAITAKGAAANAHALATFQDSNGNAHFGVDSQGLPSLGSNHFHNNTFGGATASAVTTGLIGSVGWGVQVSGGLGAHGGSTVSNDTTSAIGNGLFLDPSATANNYTVVFNNTYGAFAANNSTVAVFEWSAMFTTQTTNVNAHMSIANSAQMAHPNGFGFWWGGSGNWQWFTDNTTTRTITACTVGVAPTANRFQRFRIEFYGSATPVGVAAGNVKVAKLYIDGTLVQTITGTNVVTPAASGFEAGVQAIATAATPYLVIAEYNEWWTIVTTPFAP